METIEGYLKEEFRVGKSQLKQIYKSLVQIARLFNRSYICEYCGWDYEYHDGPSDKSPTGEDYSYSTQAMCALALSHLNSAAFWHEPETTEEGLHQAILQKKNDCIQYLCAQLNDNAEKGENFWTSRTYGDEDPLTASWIIELLSEEPRYLDSLSPTVTKKLTDAINEALKGKFDQIIHDENRAGAHAFLVYRLVLAVKKIRQDASKWKTAEEKWQRRLSRAAYWFEQELHRQLSHYHFDDFRFDAPELMYCLAGALQTRRFSPENPLISKVLDVIRAAQQLSVYWRPYRPFLVNPRGLVLMPLTVEAADALLDTLKLADRFGEWRESLLSYYKWLMTERIEKGIREDGNVINVIGWRSENAFGPPEVEKIHTWSTSRAAIFLLNYSALLDRTLQSELLLRSGLSFKEPRDLLTWNEIQPMDVGRKPDNRIMTAIQKHFVKPHKSSLASEERLNPDGSFSMFLYGPPGTSKTSIAEGLAEALGLKLVTITVSDFIVSGVQAVEQRAKVIFEVLSEMKNVVVLFDEIDRLITDRESSRYFEQGDILQLMTPSMLTKLNDLRRKKRLIFVISTNYFERMDRAIRRPGRIDQHFLITPFDQASRVALVEHFIREEFGRKGTGWRPLSNYGDQLDEIARRAPLLIFEELKRAFDRSMSALGNGDVNALLSNLESEIEQIEPSITIESYEKRFDSDTEKPYREYFFLCFLLAEVDQVDGEVKASFKKWWDDWENKLGKARKVNQLRYDKWVQEQLQKLGVPPMKAKANA